MAAAVAVCNALQRMGFSALAATYITTNQGLDTLSKCSILTDDEVENLCKVVCRPGGTIPNPAAGGPEGQSPTIPNPGLAVPLHVENNLKLMCYFLHFQQRTSRPAVPANITLNNIRALRSLQLWEKEHDNVEPPEIDAKDWPRTINAIHEYLRGCLRVTKIPLSYVVRPNEDPPTINLAEGYQTCQDELILHAPINTPAGARHPTFLADPVCIWELDPAFAWWVPYTLRKRNCIIAAVNKRYHKCTHKFGFEIPKTVAHARKIDWENGNTLWQDTIAKEMANVRVAFKILNGDEEPPPTHSFMECHMIFKIKLDSL